MLFTFLALLLSNLALGTYIFATDDGKEGYIVINEDWTPTDED